MKNTGAIIISDFHLGPGLSTGEFEHFSEDAIFQEFLRHYAASSEFQELELIIAGDFFDSIQVKVEQKLLDRVYEHHALAKIRRIVEGHPTVFSALGEFARAPGRSITFLIGNHDPALAFPAVRQFLRDNLKADIRFEANTVGRGPLIVKHGNEWDAANRFEEASIVTHDELGSYIRFPWGSYLVIDFINHVRSQTSDIDKIKPLGAFLRWALFHRPKDALVALIHFFRFVLRYRFHPELDQRIPIAQVLKILKGTCYSCDLARHAMEFLQAQERCILVLGHTHRAMLQRFSDRWVYVNTGTWNPILSFKEGVFNSIQFFTFALYRAKSGSLGIAASGPESEVELLQWVPNKGPAEFQATFFNVHMHSSGQGALRRSLMTATLVWSILMVIFYVNGTFTGRDFHVRFPIISFLSFISLFAASFLFQLRETK